MPEAGSFSSVLPSVVPRWIISFISLYRAFTGLVTLLPLRAAYRLGQVMGILGYLVFWPYRWLAIRNLTIAYGTTLSRVEIRRLALIHFTTLGANLLCSIKASNYNAAKLRTIAQVEGMETIRAALERGKGVVLVISHIGNWELFAHLCQFLPEFQWGTVYQPLGNRYIEAHIQRMRQKVKLFSRKSGFNAPTAFLRAGGALGVLVDQHAGDGGVWTPFFGRLASTSPLAALLALRTEAVVVPMAVHTAGIAKWRVVISQPIPTVEPGGNTLTTEALTARINLVLEAQINSAAPDWFWVHNRWKLPRPKFLLATYRRGIVLPPEVPASELKPFRILVRSTNWLGDAVMTLPAIQSIARGRPDAQIIVLAPEKLAGLFAEVPGVAKVLPIRKGMSVFTVAAAIRRAGPFDAAVILPNSVRSALETFLGGVPRRVGYAGHRRRWLLNQVVPEPPDPFKLEGEAEVVRRVAPARPHQSQRYAHLALTIGADQVAACAEPPPNTNPLQVERGAFLRIGICPGAEYGPTKRWLPERFAATAKLVGEQKPVNWVLFGVETDQESGEPIAKELADRCENRIGKTDLTGLIAELRGCHALLTNDTGTMHLAAYLGVPVVAVFGSTDPVLTGPLAPSERVRILRHQVECSPCFLARCPLDLRCMKAVSAEEAAAAVLELVDPERALPLVHLAV